MECPYAPELSYSEFGEQLRSKIGKKRVPVTGSMELTERCNLKCAHCYINLPANDQRARRKELTYEQWCGILDQIAEEGCLWLLLTGGEPLLRSDFLDIYAYAKRKGFIITLFTNGTMLTPEIADYLQEWPPLLVEITLYGITPETHERVTGVPGSYERCMEGIQLLRERDIPFRLKTTVMTLNVHELTAVLRYASDLGIGLRYDAILRPRPDGAKDIRDLRIKPNEVVELDFADERRVEDFVRVTETFWGIPKTDHLYTCGAGVRGFHINSYGHLSLCLMACSPSYDLVGGSFKQGWYDFLRQVRFQEITKDYKCRTCPWAALCGRCPAFAQLENGDPETVVDFVCQVAHLRIKAFGLDERLAARSSANQMAGDYQYQ